MHVIKLSPEYIPQPNDGKPQWAVKFDNWLVNDGNAKLI